MGERRTGDERRTQTGEVAVEETRKPRDRRMGDRRDSVRVPMRFLVRDLSEGGSYEEREGDLSIGGIYWKGRYPPQGNQVEVRFRLPGVPKEVRAKAEIIRLSEDGKAIGFHVRFTELAVDSELAIAKFLADR